MSLSRARSIQSTLSKHISLKFILTLYSHLIVVLAGTLFHSCPPPLPLPMYMPYAVPMIFFLIRLSG